MINSVHDLCTIIGYHDKLKDRPWFWKEKKLYPYGFKHEYKFYEDNGDPIYVIQKWEQFSVGCAYSLEVWKDYPNDKLGKKSNISALKRLLESQKVMQVAS